MVNRKHRDASRGLQRLCRAKPRQCDDANFDGTNLSALSSFMVHAAQINRGCQIRFMTQPPLLPIKREVLYSVVMVATEPRWM